MMDRTLCFGGSFNPIHNGHLICARHVARQQGFGKVRLIPSAQPPHKAEGADLASIADRLAMCRLAAAEEPQLFDVDDVEVRRTGPSYTLDTVRALKAGGMVDVYWLIGADVVADLPGWHRPLELLAETRFVVMARPGWSLDWEALPQPFRVLRECVVEAPLVDISASKIRSLVRTGGQVTQLVPESVRQYIETNRLYRVATE